MLRGPTTRPKSADAPASAASLLSDQQFVSNMEVLDALLADARDQLLGRLARLGLRRGQGQRFVVAAAGRLLRAAHRLDDLTDSRRAGEAARRVELTELAARTRVSVEQAERGLQIVLAELTTTLAGIRR